MQQDCALFSFIFFAIIKSMLTLDFWRKYFKVKEEIREEAEDVKEFIEYEETRFARWGYSFLKKILSPIIRWFWIHSVEGLENIPEKGACIVASNHESYFDFICFVAASPRKVHYLAAEKFFTNMLWRPLMKITGQIHVDRISKNKNHVHNLVFSALKQERMIGIFPEGTRSRDGKMLPAFTGVAQYALKTKVPVIPVGMSGTREIMAPYHKFPRFGKKAKIKIGKPMHFHEYYDKEHDEKLFREITDQIMLKIAELAGKEYPYIENKE